MREIKFRGKLKEHFGNKDGNVVIQKGTWIEGGIAFDEDRTWIDTKYYGQILVDKETIGQYTGLKDENDIEIFEGDIVDFSYDMFVGNFNTFVAKGIVVFEEGAFYVKCLGNERLTKDESYLLYTINIDTIEVIGNINDNPELLKGEQNL